MPCVFPRKKKLPKEAGKTFRETNKRSGVYRAKDNGDKVAWAAKWEREVGWARLRGSVSDVGRHGRCLDRESCNQRDPFVWVLENLLGLDTGLL